MTYNDTDTMTEYEIVKNMALTCGFSKTQVSYEQHKKDILYLVINCHECLTLKLFFDREWTIDYLTPVYNTHNHIQVWDRDDYLKKLFNGDIYILIDRRIITSLYRPNSSINFYEGEIVQSYKAKFIDKKKIKFFSTKEILINN